MSPLRALAVGGLMPLVSLPLALGGMAVGAAYGASKVANFALQGGKGIFHPPEANKVFGINIPHPLQLKRATSYALAAGAFGVGMAQEYHGWRMSSNNAKGIPEMEKDSMMGATGSITLNSQPNQWSQFAAHNADDFMRYGASIFRR